MRGFLLDTEALLGASLAEHARGSTRIFLQKARRERWIVCLSAISLANLGRRLARLRCTERRGAHAYLRRWLRELVTNHPQAVLSFDGAMAVMAAHLQLMHGLAPLRAQIAACALTHELAIVTLRPECYASCGVELWPLWGAANDMPNAAAQRDVLTSRNSACARGVSRPLGPLPGLATRPSRIRWGYGRRVRARRR